jgi:hypothetical protein
LTWLFLSRVDPGLGGAAWLRLAIWTLLGVAIYMFYGVQHSLLNKTNFSTAVDRAEEESVLDDPKTQ